MRPPLAAPLGGHMHSVLPPPCTSLNIKTSFSTFHIGSYVYGPDADWHVGVEILTLIPQVAEHLDQVENLH